jgi:hypothetical protein
MTLKDADEIVQQYASVLAQDAPDEIASSKNQLLNSQDKIIQAMKFLLGFAIESHSLDEKFSNDIKGAASRLPYFIEDAEARRINAIKNNSRREMKRKDLPAQDFIKHAEALKEVHDFSISADIAGLALSGELADFIATVEQLNPQDPIYYQRVYTLIGIEYSPPKKRSFWNWFS